MYTVGSCNKERSSTVVNKAARRIDCSFSVMEAKLPMQLLLFDWMARVCHLTSDTILFDSTVIETHEKCGFTSLLETGVKISIGISNDIA